MLLELLVLNAVLFVILCVLPEHEGKRPELGRRRAKAVLRESPATHRSLTQVTRDRARTVRDRYAERGLPGPSALGARPAIVGTGLLLVAGSAFVLTGDATPESDAASRLAPSEAACASADPAPSATGEREEISVHEVAAEVISSPRVGIQIGL